MIELNLLFEALVKNFELFLLLPSDDSGCPLILFSTVILVVSVFFVCIHLLTYIYTNFSQPTLNSNFKSINF